jgi:putative hydrolase of HD superfamily
MADESAPKDPASKHSSSDMRPIANFMFEVGMLNRTPRSGFQFLGSGKQSVAEHLLRVTYLAFTMGRLVPEVNADRLLRMCLLHDLPEARTGDLNYENKKYVKADEDMALRELAGTLPFGEELMELHHEFEAGQTLESRLAHDCDQLEMILFLKEQKDVGNPQTDDWIPFALKRLSEPISQQLAETILQTNSSDWWFGDRDDWWIFAGKKRRGAESSHED